MSRDAGIPAGVGIEWLLRLHPFVMTIETDIHSCYALLHGQYRKERGTYLPHWSKECGIYFVTFRLKDSIPRELYASWKNQLDCIKAGSETADIGTIQCLDRMLDKGYGPHWLARPEISDIVAGAVRSFDGTRYDLYSWCVMPTHVHVVLQTYPDIELHKILHSWKSFSASRANKILERKGPFWEKEYFDRLIRNNSDLSRYIEYVWMNPESAGMGNWRWRWRVPPCD